MYKQIEQYLKYKKVWKHVEQYRNIWKHVENKESMKMYRNILNNIEEKISAQAMP